MPATTEHADGVQQAPLESRLVRSEKAVDYMQTRWGIDTFTYQTLRHYSYETDLLPRPKVIGRYAYWRIADLDALVEAL
jgi:hypothetical protein